MWWLHERQIQKEKKIVGDKDEMPKVQSENMTLKYVKIKEKRANFCGRN